MSGMIKGIAVSTTKEVLEHKQQDGKESEGNYCYWQFSKAPRLVVALAGDLPNSPARAPGGGYGEDDVVLREVIRLYFAVEGAVIGYFECGATNPDCTELRFHSETWTEIVPIPQKHFRGFKYIDHGASSLVKILPTGGQT